MFGNLVIGYLFLGGAGAGLLFLLCCLEWSGESSGVRDTGILPEEFFRRAWIVCVVIIVFAALLLIADLGRSDRMMLLILYPTLTPLMVGTMALIVAFVVSAVCALRCLLHVRWPRLLSRGIYAAGLATGLVLMTYTGILLAGMPSVLAWNTLFVPILFVLSSLSCGCALVVLVGAIVDVRQPYILMLKRVGTTDSLIILVEALCMTGYIIWCLSGSATNQTGLALVQGNLAPWFWCTVVLMGMVLPCILERFTLCSDYRIQLIWVASSVLLGGLMLRWCIVGLAAFDNSMILQLMPNVVIR